LNLGKADATDGFLVVVVVNVVEVIVQKSALKNLHIADRTRDWRILK
jgi:hypothetical protein